MPFSRRFWLHFIREHHKHFPLFCWILLFFFYFVVCSLFSWIFHFCRILKLVNMMLFPVLPSWFSLHSTQKHCTNIIMFVTQAHIVLCVSVAFFLIPGWRENETMFFSLPFSPLSRQITSTKQTDILWKVKSVYSVHFTVHWHIAYCTVIMLKIH